MANIKITADSTCDLSPDLIEKYGIIIVPLYITYDGQSHKDGVDVKPQNIYDYVAQTGTLPKTAAVTPEDYIQVWKPYIDEGYEIIHISLSSDMSSSHQNSRIAAEELTGVYPVDSRNLSTGSGHLVLKAAEFVADGMPAKEAAEKVQALAAKVDASFVVDTLDYLYKGGRCSALAMLGANLLKLKPLIQVTDGVMGVAKKYRGKIESVLPQYVEDKLRDRDRLVLDRVFITHSGCSPEVVDAVRKKVLSLAPFKEVIETVAGCTITSHCGPNTLGILFLTK